jgi:hypothetical protein
MSVVTQLYFRNVKEINYMFRPCSGWAIIRLRLEYRRKLIYCNVDIKNGGRRSRFTMFGEVCSYIYRVWCYRGCVAIYTRTWCLPPPLALPSRAKPDTVYINTTLSSHHSHFMFHIHPLKMDLTEGSETSENHNLTPGNTQKNIQEYSKQGESLKSRISLSLIITYWNITIYQYLEKFSSFFISKIASSH